MFEPGVFIKCKRQKRFMRSDREVIFKVVGCLPCKEAKCIWGRRIGAKKKICAKCDGYMYQGKKIKEVIGDVPLKLRKTSNKPFNVSMAGFDMKPISEAEIAFELL